MSKKTISIRVPPDTYDEFETYREERGSDDDELSKADAGRRLIEAGLEVEKGVATDGGEVMARFDELEKQQRRAEREERVQNALLGGVVAAGAFAVSGVASDLVSLSVTLVAALVLIGHSLLPVVRRVSSDE